MEEQPRRGDKWIGPCGEVRVMGLLDGYVIFRSHGSSPTLLAISEWMTSYAKVIPKIGRPATVSDGVKGSVLTLLLQGKSQREVAAALGIHRNTVGSIKQSIDENISGLICKCGRSLGHLGWCPVKNTDGWRDELKAIQAAMTRPTMIWLGQFYPSSNYEAFLARPRRNHCTIKACSFPASEGTLCRQHAVFFKYPMSMHDTALDLEDTWNPRNPHEMMSLVVGHRPPSTSNLERSLKFMRQGYADDRHRNAGDGGIQSSPMMRHMGHGKGRGSSKTSGGRRRTIARQGKTHRQSHDPLKRWSREALELEANRILGEEPIELDFIPEDERTDGDDIYHLQIDGGAADPSH